ncbi:MAG TPA: alpha/beta hydrolase [Kofleriaceae bacterium]|nr:alpha/beta hydrolase [Kofleriaceae bacterium]
MSQLLEIDLPQGPIRYRDEGSGPVLLFVHGLLADGRLWRKVTPLLVPGFRCIVPDWPLGSHELPMRAGADLSPTGVAQIIADFIRALDLDDVTLVGNDSGGALCQMAAADHPGRIARLVLTPCDALEVFPPPAFAYLRRVALLPGVPVLVGKLMHRSARLRRLGRAYGGLTRRPIPDALTGDWMRPMATSRAIRRDLRAFLRGVSPELTMAAARGLAERPIPTLLVWAADDEHFTPSLGERLAAAIPGARRVVVEDTGAFLPEDQPEQLAWHIAEVAAPRSAVA